MRTHKHFLLAAFIILLLFVSFFSCRKENLFTTAVVEKVAGTGIAGFNDGPAATAQFNVPNGIAIDAAGNLYITDRDNHRIRKITTTGTVSTFAGSGLRGYLDGSATDAQFNSPSAIAIDRNNIIYVADWYNHIIRKITPDGTVTSFAGSSKGFVDGAKSVAKFHSPKGLAIDGSGNIYVSDEDNHSIRKISEAGIVSTIAGNGMEGFKNGTGGDAQFFRPRNLAIDHAGNVYVADAGNHIIRKVSPSGVVTTLAGDGTPGYVDGKGASAKFDEPKGIAVDHLLNVYVADMGNHRIRKITPDGVVTTLAGDSKGSNDSSADTPGKFNNPRSIIIDAAGQYAYITDQGNHMIRKIKL